MIVTLKFNHIDGVTDITKRENIALDINKALMKRRLKGMIGEKYPLTKDEIIAWIEQSCFQRKYLSKAVLIRKDYWKFIDNLYGTIMQEYIRKDTLVEDTDESDKKIESVYYFPGLVWLIGKGWIIVNSNDLVDKDESQRNLSMDGQKKHLGQKCNDCYNFIEQLPSNFKDLLNGNSNKEIT